MKKNFKKLRGLTLMEALLFLGLAAIVIVGAFTLYNNASSTTKMNQAKTQLQAYIGGVKSLYSSQNDFSTVSTELVINAGIAPSEAIDGVELINPWGGQTVITGSQRHFSITFETVPQSACTALLSAGLIDQGSVFELGVGTEASAQDSEFTPADAVAACASPTDNDVVFVAR